MASLEQVWSTIDTTLKKVSPRAAATLRKPATDKALAALEQALKVKLPADLRTLLSLHDGQDEKKRLAVIFAKTTWFLLPAASIISTYESLNELEADGEFDDVEGSNRDGLVKPLWWSDAWVPFATNAGGDSLCVDAGPTKKGKVGQLLWWFHDEDFREREARHLTGFFSDYAKALSGGKLTVRADGGIIGDV